VADPKCPIHDKWYLQQRPSKFGYAWRCPISGCTVAWYGKPNTSPADHATRQARMMVWRELVQTQERNAEISLQSIQGQFGIEYIGMCDMETCEKIVEWLRQQ